MVSFAVGVVMSIAAAFSWGSSMVIFKVGVKNTSSLAATYIKGLLAIPILLVIGFILDGTNTYAKLFTGMNLLWLGLGVLTLTLGDFLSLSALKQIDVSIAQPITSIYPIFTTLTLLIARIEDITWFIIGGTLLISSGVILISYFTRKYNKDNLKTVESTMEAEEFEKKKKAIPLGISLSIAASVFWGTAIVFNRLILADPEIDVISLMALRNGLMVVLVALFAITRFFTNKDKYRDKTFGPRREALILMAGGAVSWIGGGAVFFTAVQLLQSAGITTPISSISPVFVMILGSLFLKEKITIPQILGVLIIIAGSIVLSIPEMLA
jgi:drug/metabolite transporter (DMT)-like permease